MEIKAAITPKEIRLFRRYLYYTKNKASIRLSTLIVPLVIAYPLYRESQFSAKIFLLRYIIAALSFAIFNYVVLFFVTLPKKNLPAKTEGTYILNEEGIVEKMGSENRLIPWKEFTGFKEKPTLFFLLTGKSSGIIIPRTSFKDNSEETAFIELVRRKIPASK